MAHPIEHAESSVKTWGGKVEDYLPMHNWLDEMKSYGFVLNNLDHKLIEIDDTLVELSHLPEVADMINGNIKIHWTYNP